MSTYREIRSLAKEMIDGSGVTKRRKAAQELDRMLTLPEVRHRLALEATPPAHKRGHLTARQARHKALSQMWRFIIQNAVLAAQKLVSGTRSKITAEDIMLPYALIRLCDKPDEGVDSNMFRSPSYLSRKETKNVVKYCLEMLDNDEAMEVAEVKLLEMLAYICSRREYVAYFRPHNEIQLIMEEVEKRISDEEDSVSHSAVEEAANVFQKIMSTTTELGVGMHMLMPGCIKLVARWCANMYEKKRQSFHLMNELTPLMRGLTTLIRSNPEQAIAPLTRHGRAILSFCKNRYTITAESIQRDALTGYFLCHLYVCQVAGKLEGLMPGDLGSLGQASFTPKWVLDILGSVLEGGEKMQALDRPFSDGHSTSLELAARLMACAQRYHIAEVEWKQMEDPAAVFVSSIEELNHEEHFLRQRREKQEWSSCSVADLADSPFVDLILRDLCRFVRLPVDSSLDSTSPSTAMSLLNILAKTDVATNTDNKRLILLLQIVGACAETSPSGSCWLSNTQNCWHRLPPDDDPDGEVFRVSACSPDDLAVVVNIIASILDSHGGSSGDPKVQEWTLLCLVQLTEASGVQSYICGETPAKLAHLAVAWRRVWYTLFRSDLRYVAFTRLAKAGSSGELVLLLLTRIVRCFCTDPEIGPSASLQSKQSTFLFHQQADIWSLPVFNRTASFDTHSVFELIGSVIFSAGLSDRGSDQINLSETNDESNNDTGLNRDRRYRLLTFCLHSLERTGKQTVTGTIAACIAALTHGSECRSGFFEAEMIAWPADDSRCLFGTGNIPFCYTRLRDFDFRGGNGRDSDRERYSLFECLWGYPLPDPLELCVEPKEEFGLDSVRVSRWRLTKLVFLRQRAFASADLLPHSQSDALHAYVRPHLLQALSLWHNDMRLTVDVEGAPVEEDTGTAERAAPEEAHTVLQTWAMKVVVNVSLSCREELVSRELMHVSKILAVLFKSITTDIESWCSNEDEFVNVALDLLQIVRAIVEVASECQVDWPGSLVEGASCLFQFCEGLLDGCLNLSREEEELPMVASRATPEDDLLFVDDGENFPVAQEPSTRPMDVDDSDHAENENGTNKKRKRRGKTSKQSRLRLSSGRFVCVDQKCALVLASLLVSMHPSFAVCEFVARALLGVNDIEEALHAEVEIDCLGGVYAARLCCNEAVMLHHTALGRTSGPRDDSSEKGSVVRLLCHLAKLVRLNAEPDSEFHLFGYELCARVVQFGESKIRDSSITKTEAEVVVDLLKTLGSSLESRSLWLRPYFRAEQLRAAVDAFRVGKETFHLEIDKDFPRYFVLSSLSDLSAIIRRQASCAVAAALQVLPEEKVVESVWKRLPPIMGSRPDDNIREDYKTWYSSKDLGMGESNTTVEDQVWEDSFTSIENGVVDCWSAVAGATSNSEVIRQILFDLIRLSFLRPGREALCFQAIEAVAIKFGYANAEGLLDEECEDIVRRWLTSGESLLDLPLVLSAPMIIRRLLQAGRSSTLISDEKAVGPSAGNDFVHLREAAASEFVTRHCSTILPQILALSMTGLLETSVTKEGRRRIFEDRYLKELCSVFEDRFDDTVVLRVLRRHVADILAFCVALKCGSETEQGIALQIERLMESLLTKEVVQQQGSRAASVTVRRLLHKSGKVTFGRRGRDDPVDRFSDAVTEVIEDFGSPSGSGGDIFSRVDSSRTEYFLFAKYWLNKSSVKYQKLERWRTVQLLCNFVLAQIKEENYDQLQLGFCFHVLSDIILDSNLAAIHGKALTALNQILEESIIRCDSSASLKEAIKSVAKELLGLLMHTHENAQGMVVTRCVNAQIRRERSLRRSLGVHGLHELSTESGDAWGWEGTGRDGFFVGMRSLKAALADYRNQVSDDTISVLKGTYDILQLLVNNSESVNLDFDDFVGASPPYEIRESHRAVLAETDASFCAQDLVKELLEGALHQSRKAGPSPRPVILERLQKHASSSSGVGGLSERKASAAFTMDQRLLRAELVELERYLCQLREASIQDPVHLLDKREAELLVRKLMAYCDVEYSNQVRLAATRCLGEVDFERVASLSVAEPDDDILQDWLDRAICSGSLSHTLRAKAIEVLCSCLKASDVRVAMVAMETLKAVLASRDGALCLDQLEGADRSILSPFITSGRLPLTKSLFLTEQEVEKIKAFASSNPSNGPWCWDEQLWRKGSQRDTSFEEWICTLVPALLVCTYATDKAGKSTKKSTHSFLALCQRMSLFDAKFAAILFPTIVIDLLESECNDGEEMSDVDGVLVETWIGHPESTINSQLSDCFNALLAVCSFTGDEEVHKSRRHFPRGVDLAVDVLDTLRRLTQHQFLSSKSHQRNPASMKGTYKTAEQKGTSASIDKSQKADGYDSDLPPAPLWKGVPYGVVLRLDGGLVARACICTRRFASAIFYGEMFADSRFGGSTQALDLFAGSGSGRRGECLASTGDISGFDLASSQARHSSMSDLDCVRKDAISFLSVMRQCFAELGEDEARRVTDRHISDLRFSEQNPYFEISAEEGDRPASLQFLQHLDTLASSNPGSAQASLATAECLENVGLRNTLQTYISGLYSSGARILDESDKMAIRDRWFECRLHAMGWDDSLFSGDVIARTKINRLIDADSSLLPERAEQLDSSTRSPLLRTDHTHDQTVFHEYVVKALAALIGDETEVCRLRLTGARNALLSRVPLLVSREASIAGTTELLGKLEALNDLDVVLTNAESIEKMIARWGLRDSVVEGTANLLVLPEASQVVTKGAHEFSECVQELILRVLCTRYKSSEDGSTSTARGRLSSYLWRQCSVNCQLGRYHVAEGALQRLYRVLEPQGRGPGLGIDKSTLFQLRLQEAMLLESKGDFAGAIRHLKQSITRLKTESFEGPREDLLADALVTCGKWMTKYKVEPAISILEEYLQPAATLASSVNERKGTDAAAHRATGAFIALGQLVSNLFETVSARVTSVEWQKAGRSVADRESELRHCNLLIEEARKRCEKPGKRRKGSPKEAADAEKEHKELQIYRQNLSREVANAKSEREKIQRSVEDYRNLALQSFVSALATADVRGPEDISRYVYRMASLWFSSVDEKSLNDGLDKIIVDAVTKVPTFRFVPLASQLFSRVEQKRSSKNSSFQRRLQQLMMKMCLDHPYHCIIQLIALANGKKVGSGVSGRNADAFLENASDTKVNAAKDILKSLKRHDPEFIGCLIESQEVLSDAYIHLAMASTTDFHRGTEKKISFSQVCKSSAERLDQCLGTGSRKMPCPPCVLTKVPPIRPGCDYRDGTGDLIGAEHVVGFENQFSITEGGLHRPKIVICLGSKGGRFKQLVKGEDEIRQDAVMEQVFEYVNELMTRRRLGRSDARHIGGAQSVSQGYTNELLKLVTYNIVPLSPASGVLEWVESSIPFGEFLTDKGTRKTGYSIGAHSRYYPGEWGSTLCRDHLKNAPQDRKREAFDTICDHYSPAFRFFFVEKFGHSMEAWHAAKMKYTRSVAVNSIVGHILGIGDRHGSNILIHERSGNVVHIDFGIVFEQGKLLNSPEKVPFRLTQNTIDGFGPTGTEGTFTSAAEATLQVLKHNAGSLLTILSAIVSDPLYKWSVSPVKARERQRLTEKDEEVQNIRGGRAQNDEAAPNSTNYPELDKNEAAAHAITKIQEKLQGYEDGTSGEQQSVEGQVQLLINSARDRDNLCVMFPGWAPWM